jgi:hypothetical protein
MSVDRASGEPKKRRSSHAGRVSVQAAVDRTEAGGRAVKHAAAGGRMTARWSGAGPRTEGWQHLSPRGRSAWKRWAVVAARCPRLCVTDAAGLSAAPFGSLQRWCRYRVLVT